MFDYALFSYLAEECTMLEVTWNNFIGESIIKEIFFLFPLIPNFDK